MLFWSKVMFKKMVVVVLVALMVCLSTGCGYQADLQGPSISLKIIPKGENQGHEYLSRGSGLTGGSTYAAGGEASSFASTGNGESGNWSWGKVK